MKWEEEDLKKTTAEKINEEGDERRLRDDLPDMMENIKICPGVWPAVSISKVPDNYIVMCLYDLCFYNQLIITALL